ncbi:hypothetical protein [Peribacillus sp. SCS-155]|uniref:hypothetical protein n=1 Tax=Peribacillus sedimenti TaxID=3115297 RepID=UPI003906D21A
MRKLHFLVLGFSLTGLLLAGCGTNPENQAGEKANQEEKATTDQKTESESSQKNETESSQTTGGSAENQESGDTENKDESSDQAGEENTEPASDIVRIPEQNLTFKQDGSEKQQTAFVKNSDNQNFSMYVLPEYELYGEEPGKDSLVFKQNEELFMRIEVLPADVNWADIEQNTDTLLKSIADQVKPVTDAGLSVPNGVIKETISGNDVVTSVLIKDQENPVRLLIYTTKDKDLRQPFLEMGKTIVKNK